MPRHDTPRCSPGLSQVPILFRCGPPSPRPQRARRHPPLLRSLSPRRPQSHRPTHPRVSMCSVVYANCRAASRQQSRRCSANASSTACHECYLVAPRGHSSSVTTFVSPVHSSQADTDPQRQRNFIKASNAVKTTGGILHSGPKNLQPREPSAQITVRAFILLSNARSRIRSAALAPC